MQNSLFRHRSCCRLCGDMHLVQVLPMRPSPIGDAFISAQELDLPQPTIPLDVYQCQQCGHAQNLDVVNPDLLFRRYTYCTQDSLGLVAHFQAYAKQICAQYPFPCGSLVVEIGSNDGSLLRCFQEGGWRVQGVDPAVSIAQQSTGAGIPTLPDFFCEQVAHDIVQKQERAKLVVANNVYAHADDLSEMTRGVKVLLDHDGVFIFEVSYLPDILDHFLFDTIYHEHLSYHSLTPLIPFFLRHGLRLFDVEKIPTKGGSIRAFVQQETGPYLESARLQTMLYEEEKKGIHRIDTFQQYTQDILHKKEALLAFLDQAQRDGSTVVGYGASITTTTLLYHFELTDRLDYLVDDNKKKHGLYSPGRHLEVFPSSILYERKPDIVVILAWQYARPICERHQTWIDQGGTFIIPLPELQVVYAVHV